MAEQIIVFKNGERVITQLQEVFEGEGDDKRGICLLMSHPYILELISSDDPNSKMDLQVKFSKWCPYSVDFQFRVPYDTVLAIGEPDQGLAQAYRGKVESLVATEDRVPTADEVLTATAAGYENTPNWQQQQQAVAQAIADAGTPPAVTPEVV
ncbi:hypothetical protein R1080702_159 [Cyanophage S-RIM32]|uniref:Uncharacterized protein n=1 Tax=Cyanophage S-RIM32 TaxID=1278479 RepID=A0A127KMI7_9CAUD|nr:hypothetical protein BJD26_gp097 [Cyanophage S-RIM32]AMO43168.1 hypothetical protein R1080702_159 [Cyanophage S-RIM32]